MVLGSRRVVSKNVGMNVSYFRRVMRAISLSAVLLVTSVTAVLLGATAAHAHADVVSTVPVQDTQVAAPAEISVGFSEEIVLEYSSLLLFDGAGNAMPQDAATLDASGTVLATAIPETLAPGMYRVVWHNLSVDGHEEDGEFLFEVVDNLGPDNSETATPEPAVISEPEMTIDARAYQSTAGEGPTDSGLMTVQIVGWSALGAGVVAGVVALVLVFVRRRRVG